jgi:hypothetical protein
VGAKWDITEQLSLGLEYFSVKQNDFSNGTQPTGGSATSGKTTFNCALLDYRFTKAFDAYLGYMGTSVSGGMSYGSSSATSLYTSDSNATLGLGIRYAF